LSAQHPSLADLFARRALLLRELAELEEALGRAGWCATSRRSISVLTPPESGKNNWTRSHALALIRTRDHVKQRPGTLQSKRASHSRSAALPQNMT